MGSLSGTCEITEVMNQPATVSMGDKEGKEAVIRMAWSDSLEDDINQLFQSFKIKSASRISSPSHPVETGSPMRKNAMKKPITVSAPLSPGCRNSEPVSLKQALRELCLSKASEMAAIKLRSSITTDPSRTSEAGRIKHLYNAEIIGVGPPKPASSKGEETMVKITTVPEDVVPLQNDPEKTLLFTGIGSSDHSVKYSSFPEKNMSAQKACLSTYSAKTVPSVVTSSMKLNVPLQKVCDVGTESPKGELLSKEKNSPGTGSLLSASDPDHVAKKGKCDVTLPADPGKMSDKPLPLKQGQKGGRAQGRSLSSGSAHGKRGGRGVKCAPRSVKPTIRTKSIAKKKLKQSLPPALSISETNVDVNSGSALGTGQLICQRCQCSSEDLNEGLSQDTCNDNKLAFDCAKSNSKLRDKGEFSHSSKSSLGDVSSSTTSLSDESKPSRSSWSNRPHMSKDAGWEAIRQVRRQEGILGLRHFNLLKKLGCGDIGTVYLAELIGTSCLFAIKVMDNEFLSRRKKMLRAQTEREILRILDHPFLPTLYAQFTSDNLSCLVMEYCPGGDLHVLRQKQPDRHFLESAARFYMAEVLLALEYLHMHGIIYRDLKPENILVKDDGHIMLTDFDLSLRCLVNPTLLHSSSPDYEPAKISGQCAESNCIQPFCSGPSCRVPCFSPKLLPPTAKKGNSKSVPVVHLKSLPQLVAEPTDARSNSFVGTHEYLSPEIIKGEGHGAAVDWWTFGIFLYELLYGRTPFKGSGNEETLANVVLQSLRFPDSPTVSPQAQDLISSLLRKDPVSRLGTPKGAAEIKHHPFFKGLNWALIRCAVPPELPGGWYELGMKGHLVECNAPVDRLAFQLF